MNEQTVIKTSVNVSLIGCLLTFIYGLIVRDFSLLAGFILGVVLGFVIFWMIIKMTDAILHLSSMSIAIVILMFILKLVVYALGFYIAIKRPEVSLLGVFIGYMVTKISIYINGYKSKGGEMNG